MAVECNHAGKSRLLPGKWFCLGLRLNPLSCSFKGCFLTLGILKEINVKKIFKHLYRLMLQRVMGYISRSVLQANLKTALNIEGAIDQMRSLKLKFMCVFCVSKARCCFKFGLPA